MKSVRQLATIVINISKYWTILDLLVLRAHMEGFNIRGMGSDGIRSNPGISAHSLRRGRKTKADGDA